MPRSLLIFLVFASVVVIGFTWHRLASSGHHDRADYFEAHNRLRKLLGIPELLHCDRSDSACRALEIAAEGELLAALEIRLSESNNTTLETLGPVQGDIVGRPVTVTVPHESTVAQIDVPDNDLTAPLPATRERCYIDGNEGEFCVVQTLCWDGRYIIAIHEDGAPTPSAEEVDYLPNLNLVIDPGYGEFGLYQDMYIRREPAWSASKSRGVARDTHMQDYFKRVHLPRFSEFDLKILKRTELDALGPLRPWPPPSTFAPEDVGVWLVPGGLWMSNSIVGVTHNPWHCTRGVLPLWAAQRSGRGTWTNRFNQTFSVLGQAELPPIDFVFANRKDGPEQRNRYGGLEHWCAGLYALIVPNSTQHILDTFRTEPVESNPGKRLMCARRGVVVGQTWGSFSSKTDASVLRDYAYNRTGVATSSTPANLPRRILILDRMYFSRQMANLDAVMAAARRTGFEVLYHNFLMRESFEDQIRLFASVSIVVGVHGAGLQNSMFMPSRSAVIEIFPYKKAHTMFQVASFFSNHLYQPIYISDRPPLFVCTEAYYTAYFNKTCINDTMPFYGGEDCAQAGKHSTVEVPILELDIALKNALIFTSNERRAQLDHLQRCRAEAQGSVDWRLCQKKPGRGD